MSLDTLRALRMAGQRPTATVKVVAGAKPAVADWPDVVVVNAPDAPARMDWRPVIGLPFFLFVANGADDLAEQAFAAAVAAGGVAAGACWSDVAVSSVDEAKPLLRRMWESLCL